MNQPFFLYLLINVFRQSEFDVILLSPHNQNQTKSLRKSPLYSTSRTDTAKKSFVPPMEYQYFCCPLKLLRHSVVQYFRHYLEMFLHKSVFRFHLYPFYTYMVNLVLYVTVIWSITIDSGEFYTTGSNWVTDRVVYCIYK